MTNGGSSISDGWGGRAFLWGLGWVGEGGVRGRSLFIRAAVVQRIHHKSQVGPGRYHGVTRLHHLEADVVKRPDDGNW